MEAIEMRASSLVPERFSSKCKRAVLEQIYGGPQYGVVARSWRHCGESGEDQRIWEVTCAVSFRLVAFSSCFSTRLGVARRISLHTAG